MNHDLIRRAVLLDKKLDSLISKRDTLIILLNNTNKVQVKEKLSNIEQAINNRRKILDKLLIEMTARENVQFGLDAGYIDYDSYIDINEMM